MPTFLGGRRYLSRDESDAELARRCVGGDPEAFRPLVERYQKVLYNVAYRMVHDREDARDLAQGALVKAYRKLGSFDPERPFFSWLYRILVNDALSFLEKRRPTAPLEAERDAGAPGGPHEELERRERERRIQAALRELAPDSRQVIVLRYFADLSYAEMSEVLAIPEKTVKSRLFTARQRLAGSLGGEVSR